MATTNSTPSTHWLHLRLAGWARADWFETFEGISVRLADDGSTVLSGQLKDESALFGILRCIESRGMQVIACFAYQGGAA